MTTANILPMRLLERFRVALKTNNHTTHHFHYLHVQKRCKKSIEKRKTVSVSWLLLFLTTRQDSKKRNLMHFSVFILLSSTSRFLAPADVVKHLRKSIIFLPIFSFPYFSHSQVDDCGCCSKGLFLFLVGFG